MYDNDSELYNEYLDIYFNQHMAMSDAQKKLGNKCDSEKLFLQRFDYSVWFENEESTVKEKLANKEESTDKKELVDLSDVLPVEGDEEVKVGKGLKVSTPNKLLTKLSILLAQIKVGNNLKIKKSNQTNNASFLSV